MIKDQTNKPHGRLKTLVAVCFAVAYSLCCFVLSPLYFSVASDISYAYTVLPSVIQYSQVIVEILAISVFYGVIIHLAMSRRVARYGEWIAIYIIAAAAKYTANVAMTWITYYAAIPSTWIWDVANVIFYTGLELIQLAVVIWAVKRIIKKDASDTAVKCAVACGAVAVAVKIVGRLTNDVWTIIQTGLPKEPLTVVLMLLSYLSALLLGVVCFAVVLWVVHRLSSVSNGEQITS